MVVFEGQKLWKPAERDSERVSTPDCGRAERRRADRARVVREGGQVVLSGWFRHQKSRFLLSVTRQSLWLENTESWVGESLLTKLGIPGLDEPA